MSMDGVPDDPASGRDRDVAGRDGPNRRNGQDGRSAEAVFVLDEEWVITDHGRTAESLPVVDDERLVGKSLSEVFPEAARAVDEGSGGDGAEITVETGERTALYAVEYSPLGVGRGDGEAREGVLTVRDVTDSRRRREHLERYETIVETVGDAVYVTDSEGRIVHVNDRMAELMNCDADELFGQDIGQFVTQETYERSQEIIESLLGSDPRPVTDEGTMVVPDRGEVPVETTIALLPPDEDGNFRGTVGSIRDISERRERERELERYESIVQALGDPVYTLDEDGRLTFVNEAWLEEAGYEDEDEVLGEHVSIALDREEIDRVSAVIAELITDGEKDSVTYEYTARTRDGEPFPVENHISLLPPDEDGNFQGSAGVIRDISDRKRREEELERYETIVEAVGDPVYAVDPDGQLVFVNEAAAEMSGYPEEVMVGSSLHLIMDEEDVERGDEVVDDLLDSTRRRDTYEMEIITRDGDRIPVENNLALLPFEDGEFAGTAGILRDISDRKNREEDLRQYETIIETIADPVYATDRRGVFSFVNDAFEEKTGYDRSYLEENDVHFSAVTTDEDAERILDAIRDLESEDHNRDQAVVEVEAVLRDGRRITVEDRITLLPAEEGEFPRSAGVLRDISGRKRREEVLSVMNRALRHNLKTHVNRIRGYADIISSEVSESNRGFVEEIDESAAWLEQLGDTLRELQQAVQEGQTAETVVDPATVIENVANEVREQHPESVINTHLTVEAQVDAGPALRHGLEQVVENAVVHNDGDHPTIHIWLTNAPKDGWIDIHVEDDGPGIPEQERELLLEDESITQLQHGSGIGLWITRWIVEVFDGDVFIEDNDPEGTIVTMRLKRADDPSPSSI